MIQLLIFLKALGLSISLTWLIRQTALRFGIVDQPGAHKQHTVITPALGGIAVFLAFLTSIVSDCPERNTTQVVSLLGAASLVAFVGALDDVYKVRATKKLAILGVASVILCGSGWPTHLELFFPLSWVASFLWVGLVSSAFNGVDNADGAAGGLALLGSLLCGLLAFSSGDYVLISLSAAMIGALLGFLLYNFPAPKASIFLGDCGSLVIGLVLSALSVRVGGSDWLGRILLAALLLFVPLFDFLLILIVRGLKGQYFHWKDPITMCARDHTFHRLQAFGYTTQQAVLGMYACAGVVGVMAIIALKGWGTTGVYAVAAIVGAFAVLGAVWLNQAPLPKDVYAAHRSTR